MGNASHLRSNQVGKNVALLLFASLFTLVYPQEAFFFVLFLASEQSQAR